MQPMIVVPLAALVAGCSRTPGAPSFAIFGSYFPAWIVCALFGLVATLVVRAIFQRTGIDEDLPVRLLVYAGLTVLIAVATWFAFFVGSPL